MKYHCICCDYFQVYDLHCSTFGSRPSALVTWWLGKTQLLDHSSEVRTFIILQKYYKESYLLPLESVGSLQTYLKLLLQFLLCEGTNLLLSTLPKSKLRHRDFQTKTFIRTLHLFTSRGWSTFTLSSS